MNLYHLCRLGSITCMLICMSCHFSQHVFSQDSQSSSLPAGTPNNELRTLVSNAIESNHASLGGLECTVKWKITLNLDESTAEDSIDIGDFKLVEARVDPEYEKFRLTQTSDPIRKVVLCGNNLRAESYLGNYHENVIATNGEEFQIFMPKSMLSDTESGPVIVRTSMDDGSIGGMPLVDPRDYGAQSGIGRMTDALTNWILEFSSEEIDPNTGSRYVLLGLKENKPRFPHLAERWMLKCDPKFNYLPTSVVQRRGELFESKSTVEYTSIPDKEQVYFPTGSVFMNLKELQEDETAFENPQNIVFTVSFHVHDVRINNSLCEKSPFQPVKRGTLVRDSIKGKIYTAE
ncbi:hypothetical protein [Rubinisphaera italica]|uniref:Uncharacterized protein n=1 Tax=Rubinisphaera italica TaxID=2527969 RepID=A0A5C5XHF5_9PLAN|nr:hypothetical protein [Rubinisphaera italica]TWT62118.1 hypothetical protein Pan54_28570 [Rubinisphaera italica]